MILLDDVVPGNIFEIDNPSQIINMGGPWISDLYINRQLLGVDIVFDNLVYDGVRKIYFVIYNQISQWQSNNYFQVGYFDLLMNEKLIFPDKFKMIFIKNVVRDNVLNICLAFHGHENSIEYLFSRSI